MESKIDLQLLKNGLCFLEEAVRKLKDSDIDNNDENQPLKYAILHLFSGIFLILKEKLKQEHWSLLFEDIDKADLKKLKTGDFKGVSFQTCLNRLENISSLKLSREQKKYLNQLQNNRNKLEHFFQQEDKEAFKSLLVINLDIVFAFITKNFQDLPEENTKQINDIKDFSYQIGKFVKSKLKEIKPQLKDQKVVLFCPDCSNKALILDKEAHLIKCLFCHKETDADNYEEIYSYNDPYDYFDQRNCYCPECEAINSLVSAQDEKELVCLQCFADFDKNSFDECSRCGDYIGWSSDDGVPICSLCLENLMSD